MNADSAYTKLGVGKRSVELEDASKLYASQMALVELPSDLPVI